LFSDFAPATSDILHVLSPPLAASHPIGPWPHLARPATSLLGARRCRPGRRSPAPPLARVRAPAPGGARPRRPLDGARRCRSCLEPPRAALAELGHAGPWQRSPVSPRTELARASPTWSLPALAGRSSLPRPHLIVSRVGLEAGVHQQLASGRTPEQPEPASSFSPADLKRSHES
jgi:hypothetical protein